MTSSATEETSESLEPLPGLYQRNFPKEMLVERRRRVATEIGDGAIALVQGAPRPGSSSLFRQSNEMYYLTGVEVPNAYVVVHGGSGATTLYLERHDPGVERSEGPQLNADNREQTIKLTGVEDVKPLEQLAKDLAMMSLKTPPTVYVPSRPAEGAAASRDSLLAATASLAADPWAPRETREGTLIRLLRERFPAMVTADLTPTLDAMREVKDPIEIDLLRRAGHLTAAGILAAMQSTAPGRMEYQLAAVASFAFLAGGARGDGYRGIIGGGTNAWHGHYGRQHAPLQAGDLVLMDYAADYAYYTSDIGRVWPVTGTYTNAQRTLYGFIVQYHRELLARIGPGESTSEITDAVAQVMSKVIDETRWAEPSHEAAARGALEFRGHFSHPVGMAVHDVGDYRTRPLAEGAVFSLDPMLWIPEERGYIRCEDTLVITSDGYENLTGFAPLDCDEIEAAMAVPGILDQWDVEAARFVAAGDRHDP